MIPFVMLLSTMPLHSLLRLYDLSVASVCEQPRNFSPVSCALLPSSLLTPLYKLHQSFVLVDPSLPDAPIVHASAGFLQLTGRPRCAHCHLSRAGCSLGNSNVKLPF